MMTRMQVTLDAEQHRRAKRKAAAAGLSLAEYIRRVVTAAVDDAPAPRPDVTEVFDLGAVAGSDVARRKDDYLGAATSGEPGPAVL